MPSSPGGGSSQDGSGQFSRSYFRYHSRELSLCCGEISDCVSVPVFGAVTRFLGRASGEQFGPIFNFEHTQPNRGV